MIKLDNAMLIELGLGRLAQSHRSAILRVMYDELEARVGIRLTGAMNSDQLSRFEALAQTKNRPAALAFLETELPDYRDVVKAEFELLRAEINSHRRDIQALSRAYADIPIELPPKKDIWVNRQEAADRQ